MADIQRISHTHEAVINWLVLNPEKSMRECADVFGYTQAWLSTLVHSDIFQMALRERQEAVAARVTQSIPQKLRMCTEVALDKLANAIEQSEDPEFLLDAADRTLHRMGFAPQSARNPAGSPAQQGSTVTNNNLFVLGEADLHEARKIMAQAGVGALPVPAGGDNGISALEGEVVSAAPEA
jgi:hypothetical protein